MSLPDGSTDDLVAAPGPNLDGILGSPEDLLTLALRVAPWPAEEILLAVSPCNAIFAQNPCESVCMPWHWSFALAIHRDFKQTLQLALAKHHCDVTIGVLIQCVGYNPKVKHQFWDYLKSVRVAINHSKFAGNISREEQAINSRCKWSFPLERA